MDIFDKIARRGFFKFGTLALGAIGVGSAATLGATNAEARNRRNLDLEVCCNGNSIRFEGPQGPNPNNLSDLGPHPYYGASFVVQGIIYPSGTLPTVGSGILGDGSPQFPDSVLGTWTCRGWFVGDSVNDARGGIFTPTGPFVATTQLYDLDSENPGAEMLVTDGVELIDLDVPFQRAITGGTGIYRKARGEVTQTAIAVNSTNLFNFTFSFKVR
ncbi:MAG: hypothetical protein AAF462_03100 [Thermodesulfobacteriota bacterium]